ncbi:MAG: Gfo/Idh/MocA family oxidoreductase [Candidatus Hydrogenedentes bacterium]|nr:Gfo/Idh/MocA family oxidoreductase [Candidatus Hydrogenedentota bacterium]
MQEMRLGFIGGGFIARFQAMALRSVRGARLTGIYAPRNPGAFAAHAASIGHDDCAVYKSVADLCNHCDAVAVFAPNHARLEIFGQIADAAKAGAQLKGVICEKPLGRTIAEAKEIVQLMKDAKLPTAYFENQLHMKAIKSSIAQLAPVAKEMGPLALARSSEEHAGPHEGWFWDPTRQGGGVLSDMGCHSIAVSWFVLTPHGQSPTYLKPVAVNAEVALLKWGLPKYRQDLLQRMGVDYAKTPAEDFATGMLTFEHPDSSQRVKAQFTNSWMYDKQGLRLAMDGLGPGYAFELNTLKSPLEIFIGDAAAEAVANAEVALEKSTASRGLLTVQPNEADLYGYVDELEDAVQAFSQNKDAFLNLDYGLEITRLCQAAYFSAEKGRAIDLEDLATQRELDTYVSLIAQGKGQDQLNAH